MSVHSEGEGAFAGSRERTSHELLQDLDEGQREAATTLRGPVCILAGAGTGKTRTITRRIAHGINTGAYSPERVLALTFTARAAGEMKTRLRHLNAGTVEAATFHAAALRQLNHFWPTVVGGDAPRVLGGKAQLLTEAARNVNVRVDSALLRDIAGDIEWRKVSNLPVDAYAELTTRPAIGKLTRSQILAIHAEYERIKDDRRTIDFEDVLLLTTGLLANEEAALMQVRERYRFFVVDEYQDVSPLQHDLLRLWLGDRRDLCVVGDASQTIYSFTGATNRYLLEFSEEFPEATVIRLDTNYRSSAPIVQLANDVMRENAGAVTLRAAEQTGAKPECSEYPDDGAEARGVAARVAREIATGTPARDIAVLYRVNSQSAALEQALSDAGVSYQVAGGVRFFDMPEVKQAIMALRGAAVSVTNEPLFKSVSDVMRSLGWTQSPPSATGAVRARWEAFNALVVLADTAGPGTTLREFASELQQRQETRHEPTMDAVTLSSIHAAKGLEWPSVYLVGLAEGLLPVSFATSAEQVSEERRVFYVAVTRAGTRLTMSWASSFGSHGAARARSRFLSEIDTGMRR